MMARTTHTAVPFYMVNALLVELKNLKPKSGD